MDDYKNYSSKSFSKLQEDGFSIGNIVKHNTFGKGVIKRIYGKCYEVQFENAKKVVSEKELEICK